MYNLKRFLFENVKDIIPNRINSFILSINKNPNLIFGKEYKNYFERVSKNNQTNHNLELELLNIVNFCLRNVPYYKNIYKDKIITSLDEFKNIIQPIDKDIVLANFDDFVLERKKYDFVTTGGTSGKPLNLFLPKNRFTTELATLHYVWSKVGYNFSKRGVIRNNKLNKDYIINPVSKEFIFDGFRLNDEYFEVIYKTLKKNNIKFLHGYTSNLFLFGQFLIRKKKDYSFIKGLFTTSENSDDLTNTFFEETLQIPHINFFGHTEKLVFGAYCKGSNNYHVDSFYGYTEVIDENNEDTLFGEITGTTLHNYGMPLLRYKTGDFAKVFEGNCPSCNFRGLLLEEIYGRWDGSKIYNSDNTFVTTTALNLHNDLYHKINGLQYYQNQKGILEVRIIKGNNFDEEAKQKLENEIKSKFNKNFRLKIVYVEKLEKKENGKFLMLISEVSD